MRKVLFFIGFIILRINILNANPYGMGEAYTSYGNSVYGIKYNPASVVELKNKEFAVLYTKYYSGLENDSLNRYDFLLGTKIKYIPVSFEVDYFTSNLFDVVSYNFGGGYELYNFKIGVLNKVINYKYSENEYTVIDPVFRNKKGVTVYTFDIGAIYNLFNIAKIGVSYQNINRPIISLQDDSNSRLESVIRAGASKEFFKFIVVNFDAVYNFSFINLYTGARIKLGKFMALAGGIKLMRKRINFNIGMEAVISENYEFSYALKIDAGMTHYLGLKIIKFLSD